MEVQVKINTMNREKKIIRGLFLFVTILVLYLIVGNKGSRRLEFNQPINGIVQDEGTAIKIAEIIGLPVFGKNLKDYKPFHARLENDSIWYVYGLPRKSWFKVQMGGGPVFEIQKIDGRLLKVYISR